MKIKNKEIWIILFAAIILVSAFIYKVKAIPVITGIMIDRDVVVYQDDYERFVNEHLTYPYYLPGTSCTGYTEYDSFVYKSDVNPKADINGDGKIDEIDAAVLSKAYGCNSTMPCWNQPVEACWFGVAGRKFKDPTRDCKMDQDDENLITQHYGERHNLMGSPSCENSDVCKADINQDGVVDVIDAVIVSNKFNKPVDFFERIAPALSSADLNGNGVVDILDAIILSNYYGKTAIESKLIKVPLTHVSGYEYSVTIDGKGISRIRTVYKC